MSKTICTKHEQAREIAKPAAAMNHCVALELNWLIYLVEFASRQSTVRRHNVLDLAHFELTW